MKLKKIFGILICTVMLFSTVSAADTFEAQEASQEYELLLQFGFLPPSLSSQYIADKAVTRGEFAALMANCLNLSRFKHSPETSVVFSDVSENTLSCKEIELCADFGLISGDGYGMFHPTRKITYVQAIKIVMSALGYDELAAQKGGYPVGYMVCASECGVIRGSSLSANSVLTAFDAYRLLTKALDTGVLKQTAFGDGIRQFDSKSGETILSTYHNIFKFEGKLRATSEASFEDIAPLNDDEILIDKSIYKSNVDCTKLLGQQIYYYFNDSTETVVAVIPKSNTAETLTVTAEDIVSFRDNTLKYAVGDKIYKAELTREAEIIYNGRPAKDMSDDDFVIKNGEIRFIGSEDGNTYDAAVVSCAECFMIRKSDAYNEVFYDLYDSTKSFSTKNMERIIFKDEFGDNMSLGEIGKYDVVSVLLSRDKKYASLYYSNTETEGTVESLEETGNTVNLVIGGKSYTVAENYKETAKKIHPGEQGIYVLDIYGNIAGCKPYESTRNWGYLIATEKKGELGGVVRAKLLLDSGEITVCNLSKNILIDGKMMSAVEGHNILQTAQNGQLIRYCIIDSQLKYIDTVNKGLQEADDTMVQLYSGYDSNRNESVRLMWNRYQQILGSKVPIGAQAKVFRVPPRLSGDDEDYMVLNPSYFLHDTSYFVDAYRIGNTSHSAQAVVMYKDGNIADPIESTVEATVIDYISRADNGDGKINYVIHGLREGKKVSNVVKKDEVIEGLKSIKPGNTDNKHTLVCGDIVKLGLDSVTQEVTAIALCYERENDCIKSNTPAGTSITTSDRMMKANVYAEDNGNLWLTQNELASGGIELTVDDIESVQATLYKIYRYGIGNDSLPEVTVSNVSEITDYKSNAETFSKIVMLSRYNNPGVIVIYE